MRSDARTAIRKTASRRSSRSSSGCAQPGCATSTASGAGAASRCSREKRLTRASELHGRSGYRLRVSERSRALAGLFCVVFSTLLLEVLLTRFFALKLAYHHSFVMISLALLGSGVGALVVPLARERFLPGGRCNGALLAAYAWCFSVSALAGILAFCSFGLGATSAALTIYTLLVAPPFVFSGVVVASVLAGSTAAAGTVYAVDLLAAALGAGIAPFLLETAGG